MDICLYDNPNGFSKYKFAFQLKEKNEKGVKVLSFCCQEGDITYEFEKNIKRFKRMRFLNWKEMGK